MERVEECCEVSPNSEGTKTEISLQQTVNPRSFAFLFGITYVSYLLIYLLRKLTAITKGFILLDPGTNISLEQLGALDAVMLMGYAIPQPASGALVEGLGSSFVASCGFMVAGYTAIMFAFQTDPGVMTALWALHGVGQSPVYTSLISVITREVEPSRLTLTLGLWNTSQQLGSLIANFVVSYLSEKHGWRAAYFVLGNLGVCMTVSLYFLLPSAKADVDVEPFTMRSFLWTLVKTRKVSGVAANSLLYGCLKFVRYGLIYWTPLMLQETLSLEPAVAARVAALGDGAGILGSVFAGFVTDKLSAEKRARMGLCSLVLCMGALGLLHERIGEREAVPLLMIAGFFISAADLMYGSVSIFQLAKLHKKKTGDELTATLLGFINGLASIGGLMQGVVTPHILNWNVSSVVEETHQHLPSHLKGWARVVTFYALALGISIVAAERLRHLFSETAVETEHQELDTELGEVRDSELRRREMEAT